MFGFCFPIWHVRNMRLKLGFSVLNLYACFGFIKVCKKLRKCQFCLNYCQLIFHYRRTNYCQLILSYKCTNYCQLILLYRCTNYFQFCLIDLQVYKLLRYQYPNFHFSLNIKAFGSV
jgi:hypothetical protein